MYVENGVLTEEGARVYLDRLGFEYDQALGHKKDADFLGELATRHLQRFPFDTSPLHVTESKLELKAGRAVLPLYNEAFQVVVRDRIHGGFCSTLNGLFMLLLQFLGYEVVDFVATVYLKDKQAFLERGSHYNLLVNGNLLCDVGFGGVRQCPYVMPLGGTRGPFTLKLENDEYVLKRNGDPSYKFKAPAAPMTVASREALNVYSSSHETAVFTKMLFTGLLRDNYEYHLILYKGGDDIEFCVFDEAGDEIRKTTHAATVENYWMLYKQLFE